MICLWTQTSETAVTFLLLSPHSAAWSEVMPIPTLGNLLGDEKLRVSVALRIGANISCVLACLCKCGVKMDPKGYHGFSCRLNEGSLPRHAEINSIVKRSLGKIGLPCILEPTGLDRGDSRRPNGITAFPWKHGKFLVWDSTVVNSFFKSHIIVCSIKSGSGAEIAEKSKSRKYHSMVGNFLFQPVAYETTGCCGPSTGTFVEELSRKISEVTEDSLVSSENLFG